jgi:hypothetical protein
LTSSTWSPSLTRCPSWHGAGGGIQHPGRLHRGIGIVDMAYAIQSGRPHRASGELARHVIDITLGIFESARTACHVPITTRAKRPAALPLGLKYNQLDV